MDAQQLEWCRQRLSSQTPLIGGRLRRNAAEALARDGSPEAVQALVKALAQGNDEPAQRELFELLRHLAEQDSIGAQEALCRLVIERDYPLAHEAAVAGQYAPRDPHQRALFYLLTEQWDRYEELDFDQSLLRIAYELADEALRGRIAGLARRVGRIGWVEVVVGGRQARRLGELTDAEWEAALAILVSGQRWQEMWRLAQEAPAVWSVRLLRRLTEVGWLPKDESEEAGLAKMLRLAARCGGDEPEAGGLVRCQATLKGHWYGVQRLAISPDGRLLASNGGATFLWRLADGAAPAVETQLSWSRSDKCMVISPDGRLLAGQGLDDAVQLWSLPDGSELWTLPGRKGHTSSLTCLAISPDGELLASGSLDRTVRLWRLPDGAALRILEGHSDWVNCLAISPDGRLLASGSKDGTVRLWRLPDGALLKTLRGHRGAVECLAITPDGRLLGSGGWDRTVRLWRLPDGALLNTLKGHRGVVCYLATTPDGRLLSSRGCGPEAVRVWQLPDGVAVATVGRDTGMSGDRVGCLAITADGRLLVTGSDDGTVRLWSLPDGAALQTLPGHYGVVYSLAITPGGRLLASGGWDKTVRLWTLELLRACRLPAGQTSPRDLMRVEQMLHAPRLSDGERGWLEFLLALMNWRRRFDVEVADAPRRVSVGDFDIEIEG